MWVRTEPGEMVNLDHSHHIYIVEHGAPKFQIEVVCAVGSERYILAYINMAGAEGRRLALDYIEQLSQSMQRAGKTYTVPMYPRHSDKPKY